MSEEVRWSPSPEQGDERLSPGSSQEVGEIRGSIYSNLNLSEVPNCCRNVYWVTLVTIIFLIIHLGTVSVKLFTYRNCYER